MDTYNWASPGGLYVVPDSFKQRFLSEFPGYRIRWSLKRKMWQIEQPFGNGALPPFRIDPADDSLIRARDGFWLVMSFQPGDRMPCPQQLGDGTGRRCGYTVKVPLCDTGEAVCSVCRAKGRDGRTIAGFWPFDERLMEHLRFTDPNTGGVKRASAMVDKANFQLAREADRKASDASSLDYVDYRWISGIPSSTGKRRQIDSQTFR